MNPNRFIPMLVLLSLLAGCAGTSVVPATGPARPTPTAHSLFAKAGDLPAGQGNRPVVQPQAVQATRLPATTGRFDEAVPEAAPGPTLLPTATWIPTRPAAQPSARIVSIYSDYLLPGWEVVSPGGQMTFDLKSSAEPRTGRFSLAVSPQQSHGKLFIVAGEKNRDIYPRAQVYGVTLHIYSGELGLDPYDLALTVIGSNVYTYWREDDKSVESKTPYEETFLRYLEHEEKIPPDTWAEVTIWLNEMRFDPDYEYVTGLYLTNRKGFTRTFYIDDITLMLKPNETPYPTPTPNPHDNLQVR